MSHYTIIGIFYDSQETIILDLITPTHYKLPEDSELLYTAATLQRIKELKEVGTLAPDDDPMESEQVAGITWVAAIKARTLHLPYTTDWKDAI